MKGSAFSQTFFFSLVLTLTYLIGNPLAVSSQADTNSKIFLPLVSKPHDAAETNSPGSCLLAEEYELGRLINEYRASVGLPSAPLSKSLTMVAQYHVQDLQSNYPEINRYGKDSRGIDCNMHTWSNTGFWTPVCYTGDHAYAEGMWFKPKEISRGIYDDYGYEIAAGYWGKDITAQDALSMWKNSPGHNNVILERDIWAGQNWPAMGIGISKTYAVVWFSSTTDPQGTVSKCP